MLSAIKFNYAQLTSWAFPFLCGALFLSLFNWKCRDDYPVQSNVINLDSLARLVSHYENAKGQVVSENKQLQEPDGKRLKQLTDSLFALKKKDEKRIKEVEDYTRIIQEYKTREKFAAFKNTGNDYEAGRPADTLQNYVRVPKPFSYQDSTLKFSGIVQRSGVMLDSITMQNTIHLRTIVNRVGFLKLGRETTVQQINTNPDITILGLTSVHVPKKTSRWNRWIKPVLFAAAGAFTAKQF